MKYKAILILLALALTSCSYPGQDVQDGSIARQTDEQWDSSDVCQEYVGRQFGYRVNLYFYSNGIFEVDWSNGAMNYGVDFYRLSPDGYNVYPVESVSVKVPYDLIIGFYHDAESEDEISEKEYNAILQKYMAVGEADLNWSEIVKE